MLAYVFWHRPRGDVDVGAYEEAQLTFHRSLARRPPVGLRGSFALRVPELPWLGDGGPGYEDWYLLGDFSALGVLNEAAVGRGHRSSHDRAARLYGAGAAGLYCLMEGEAHSPGAPGEASPATWVQRPVGAVEPVIAELLGDGMNPARSTLWRRQLVLGPAPELCLSGADGSPGVAPGRLPAGWTVQTLQREVLFGG